MSKQMGTIVVVYGNVRNALGDEGLADHIAYYVGDSSDFDEFWKKTAFDWLQYVRREGITVLNFCVTFRDLSTRKTGTLYSTFSDTTKI